MLFTLFAKFVGGLRWGQRCGSGLFWGCSEVLYGLHFELARTCSDQSRERKRPVRHPSLALWALIARFQTVIGITAASVRRRLLPLASVPTMMETARLTRRI